MSKNTLQILNEIFNEVFQDENIFLDRSTSSNDIEKWDSLNNMHLVVSIEKRFKLKVTLRDIRSWGNVGDVCDWIEQKIA